MLYKSLEFKNAAGQKVKIVDIPVLGVNNRYYFMIQVRLQTLISSLYDQPLEKSCWSFRDYMKTKMKWPDFNDLFGTQEIRTNA